MTVCLLLPSINFDHVSKIVYVPLILNLFHQTSGCFSNIQNSSIVGVSYKTYSIYTMSVLTICSTTEIVLDDVSVATTCPSLENCYKPMHSQVPMCACCSCIAAAYQNRSTFLHRLCTRLYEHTVGRGKITQHWAQLKCKTHARGKSVA